MENLERCHLPQPKAEAYRERKRLHGLDQPSTSKAALQNPDDETPMECTGSENDVVMMDSPEIFVVSPKKTSIQDGHVAIVILTRRS
jgi:hypothetical protein